MKKQLQEEAVLVLKCAADWYANPKDSTYPGSRPALYEIEEQLNGDLGDSPAWKRLHAAVMKAKNAAVERGCEDVYGPALFLEAAAMLENGEL